MATREFQATTTALQCLAYNEKRKTWLITNNSGSPVFISENAVNVTDRGTPLAVSESIDASELWGDDPTLAIYVQTLVGTADLRIIESFGKRSKQAEAS